MSNRIAIALFLVLAFAFGASSWDKVLPPPTPVLVPMPTEVPSPISKDYSCRSPEENQYVSQAVVVLRPLRPSLRDMVALFEEAPVQGILERSRIQAAVNDASWKARMDATLGEIAHVADGVKALPSPDSERLKPIHSDLLKVADELHSMVELIEGGLASTPPDSHLISRAVKEEGASALVLFDSVHDRVVRFCLVS